MNSNIIMINNARGERGEIILPEGCGKRVVAQGIYFSLGEP